MLWHSPCETARMTFLWREVLWLVLLMPALPTLYLFIRRDRKRGVPYAGLKWVAPAFEGSMQRARQHIPPLLFFLGLLAVIAAAARPSAVFTLPSERRTIVLAIDVSYSMAANDIAPSRLAAAQAAAKDFIRAQPRDVRIAIVAFAGYADMVLSPTTSRSAALAAIDGLTLQYSTAIGSGLIAALLTLFPQSDIGGDYDIFGTGHSPVAPRAFSRNRPPRPHHTPFAAVPPGSFSSAAIVLLTDGRETLGVPHYRAAQLAAERGIRVFTVGFGEPDHKTLEIDGEAMDVSFDEEALKTIAAETHGAYFHATDANELQTIYRTLSGQVVLEQKWRELTAVFTALGAMLMMSCAVLSLSRWGRLV